MKHRHPSSPRLPAALLLSALVAGCPEREPARDADLAPDDGPALDLAADRADDVADAALADALDAADAPGNEGGAAEVGLDADAGADALDAPEDAHVPDVPDVPDVRSCVAAPWRTTQVTSGGNWGGATAVAVDPRGVPHVVLHRAVYGSYGARELLYASPTATGSWDLEAITTGTGNDRDDTTELAFDAAGAPHVVFPGLVDGGPHPSFHATRAGAAWTLTALRGGNTWASLAIARGDIVHVVSGQTEINHARRAPDGTWTHEAQRPARCPAVAAAADGTLHVSYVSTPSGTGNSDLYHATRSPTGTWAHERVEALGVRLEYVCETWVGVGPGGAVHLVYTGGPGLRHAQRAADGTWRMQEAPGGRSPAVAIDARGGLHLVFGEPLTYAWLAPGGAWQMTVIDSRVGGVPGADNAIAVDATGAVHIASYDETARTSPSYPIYYTTGRVCGM